MKLDMDQIDFLKLSCLQSEAESALINYVRLLFREYQDASKFSVQDAKNVCASNALLIQWSLITLLNRLTII